MKVIFDFNIGGCFGIYSYGWVVLFCFGIVVVVGKWVIVVVVIGIVRI